MFKPEETQSDFLRLPWLHFEELKGSDHNSRN